MKEDLHLISQTMRWTETTTLSLWRTNDSGRGASQHPFVISDFDPNLTKNSQHHKKKW